MPKYRVYGVMTASAVIGEYEANDEEEARELADMDKQAGWHPSVCHQCAGTIDLGDIYESQVELIEG